MQRKMTFTCMRWSLHADCHSFLNPVFFPRNSIQHFLLFQHRSSKVVEDYPCINWMEIILFDIVW